MCAASSPPLGGPDAAEHFALVIFTSIGTSTSTGTCNSTSISINSRIRIRFPVLSLWFNIDIQIKTNFNMHINTEGHTNAKLEFSFIISIILEVKTSFWKLKQRLVRI